jgi:hypothetical protein
MMAQKYKIANMTSKNASTNDLNRLNLIAKAENEYSNSSIHLLNNLGKKEPIIVTKLNQNSEVETQLAHTNRQVCMYILILQPMC